MKTSSAASSHSKVRLYDGDGESLILSELAIDKVTLLPGSLPSIPASSPRETPERLRILWGQDLLRDLLDRRYRAVVCGVNDVDNTHGVISQLVEHVGTSQWTSRSITSYAKMFQESVAVHAAEDKEPYVLKFDLDSILVLGILRPRGREHFTLTDLSRGFRTVTRMLRERADRMPVASISFLSAKANRLLENDGSEPSFETVLRTMFESGFRGDVYAAPTMWQFGHVGVFPTYPFPDSVDDMRRGGF
ncbi:MAG: hypothetical protein SFZ23_11945 [Planctomycetota bacterium]|nr:hypothetical protein [Planctomycetota bacterium]